MKAPLWPIIGKAEEDRIQESLERRDWSRGLDIEEFENAFAEYCDTKYALLVNSGTDALTIALKAAGVEPGDEVIVPGLTWPSSAIAIMECGAQAVIVDVEPDTYSICPQRVRRP